MKISIAWVVTTPSPDMISSREILHKYDIPELIKKLSTLYDIREISWFLTKYLSHLTDDDVAIFTEEAEALEEADRRMKAMPIPF